jgi:septin family protein
MQSVLKPKPNLLRCLICRWGAAYALNREHSDLLTLKRLLLGDKVDSLYAMLDESYNRWAV